MGNNRHILLFTLLVLIVVIVSSLCVSKLLSIDAKKLLSITTELNRAVNSRDWTSATALSVSLDQKWAKTEGRWALFINHHEIDNITSALRRSTSFISAHAPADSAASLNELRELIGHIPAMERLTLRNIL